MSDTIYNDLK